jgi:hypothetical protein
VNFSWPFLRDDVASIGISYLDNILLENLGAGISHEIGYDTVIAGNWASGNGRAFQVRSILQKCLNVAENDIKLNHLRHRLEARQAFIVSDCKRMRTLLCGCMHIMQTWLWSGQIQVQNSRNTMVRNILNTFLKEVPLFILY